MALSFNKRIDHLNFNGDEHVADMLSTPAGASPTSLLLAYAAATVSLSDASSHIFFNTYTISNSNLGVPVDVSGAEPSNIYGYHLPSIAKLTDGTILCGYSIATFVLPYKGFVIRESTDGGVTWATLYQPAGYQNHFLVGFGVDGANIIAVTMADPAQQGIIAVHRRTGPGTWTVKNIFTGTTSNYWNLTADTKDSIILRGSNAVIIGNRIHSPITANVVSCLHTTDLSTWTETPIDTQTPSVVTSRRIPQCRLGADGVIRAIYSWYRQDGVTPIIHVAYSPDFGVSWTLIGEPTVFTGIDGNSEQIYWPEVDHDLVSLALDAANNWFVSVPQDAYSQPGTDGNYHVFKSTNKLLTGWTLNSTDGPISNGTGTNYSTTNISPSPAKSLFAGKNYYRIVCAWNSTDNPNRAEIWLLKGPNLGAGTGGGAGGGGGRPIGYPDS